MAVCNCHERKRWPDILPGTWVVLGGLIFSICHVSLKRQCQQRGHQGAEVDLHFCPIPAVEPPSSLAASFLLTSPHLLLSTPPHHSPKLFL